MPVAAPAFLQPSASVDLAGAAAAGGANILDFTMAEQELSNWCWAATTVSVRAYYDHVPPGSQCALATAKFGWNACPPGPSNGPNDLIWALDDALGTHLARAVPGALRFDDIVTEIDGRRPVCCHLTIGPGHFNAIIGYDTATRAVDIVDPLYGPRNNMPYDAFCTDYRGGRWDYSYLTR